MMCSAQRIELTAVYIMIENKNRQFGIKNANFDRKVFFCNLQNGEASEAVFEASWPP